MHMSKLIKILLVLASFNVPSALFARPPAGAVHKKKYAMGTVFEIVAYDPFTARADKAIDKAFDEIARLDEVMSNYKPDSDLRRLNRSDHSLPQVVGPDLYRVIAESLIYSRLSAGKFDITVGPLVDLWKAPLSGDHTPSPPEVEKARNCVGYEKIELLPPHRIEFHSACTQVDLGSIGKGYAVDRAAEVLRANGVKNALINAGGSTLYGMGSPPDQAAWVVHLRDPSKKNDPQVSLRDNSVSTSEQSPSSLLGNGTAGHIIDPQGGLPAQTTFAVSVIAKTATASDALSTMLLLVGPANGKSVVKTLADTSAIWISPAGQVEEATSGPQILMGSRISEGRDDFRPGNGTHAASK
jgi:FAD:protein FMN transferase